MAFSSSYALYLLLAIAFSFVLVRVVASVRILLPLLRRRWRSIEDRFHLYRFYKIPEFSESFQENQLYKKVSLYINSLPSLEDSDVVNLYSGKNPNDISLQLVPGQIVRDSFLGAKISWKKEPASVGSDSQMLVLKIREDDKRQILRPYLQHIQTIAEEIELKKKDVRLFTNTGTWSGAEGRWRSVPFTHPATLDTVAMDSDLKQKVRSDLESFVKARQYYQRLGRIWKRSYLLYGPAGTGKTSFVAAMAKFLAYDLYDVDLSRIADNSDLRSLLLQTSGRSVILIEDLDHFLAAKSEKVSLSGIMNFMDGVFSCCGEERLMVFTMNNKENVDPALLRPGRVDVHIYFPLCDFSAFRTLASSHLGVKDHKLFPQVEEVFQAGASMSQAEISEILIVNRCSPSRALKSVISALQSNAKIARRPSTFASPVHPSEPDGPFLCKDMAAVREIRKFYGLLRMRSGSARRKSGTFDLDAKEDAP